MINKLLIVKLRAWRSLRTWWGRLRLSGYGLAVLRDHRHLVGTISLQLASFQHICTYLRVLPVGSVLTDIVSIELINWPGTPASFATTLPSLHHHRFLFFEHQIFVRQSLDTSS
ncbi:hypothetical protein DL546_009296 [Coniochaeta pulveracea]|uniref:Uncharacterized protein n=1 Tax=Coniochaeta pulveracea TaxID=177199 RepID=A0A420YI71_9PEZI|nr:hypothetical protein DL546_009296 [Coniochaeta pulveracea]